MLKTILFLKIGQVPVIKRTYEHSFDWEIKIYSDTITEPVCMIPNWGGILE